MQFRKIILAITLTIALGANMVYADGTSKKGLQFRDLKSHWSEKIVKQLIDKEIISGYEDGTFRPNNSITRAEFSTILRKSVDVKKVVGNAFDDTKDHWGQEIITTLVSNGIIDENEYKDDKFLPDKKITRVEMAKMIVRALDLDEKAKEYNGKYTGFADNEDMKDENKGYINMAAQYKIISGYDDKTFKPTGEATRAEASTMIKNFLDRKDNKEEIVIKDLTKVKEETKIVEIKKEYKELSEFKCQKLSDTPEIANAKYLHFVYTRSKKNPAKPIENVYFLKESDLPIKITDDIVITDIEADEKDLGGDRSVYVSGYVLATGNRELGLGRISPAIIDNNNLFRFRTFMRSSYKAHYEPRLKKYPNLKGYNTGEVDVSITNPGEKFTLFFPIKGSYEYDMEYIQDYNEKFTHKDMKYILLYSYQKGENLVVFENPYK